MTGKLSRRSFSTTLLGGALAAAHIRRAEAAPVTLKLGHATFEAHPFHDASLRFKKAVEEISGGQVKVQIFPARQLGDVKELMEGVQFGTVDMTVNSSSALATTVPAIDAFQLPGVTRSYPHFARLAASPEAKAILQKLEPHGMVGLGLYDGGRRHFLTVDKPVRSMADFHGLKTRVAPSRLFLDMWKAVGVNPTPMNYGEVYSALETGTLDAVEINLTSIEAEKYYEIAHNVTLTGHYFWPGLLLINKRRLEKLGAEQQKAIREAADRVVEPQVLTVKALDDRLVTSFKERGMTLVEPSEAFEQNFRSAVQPVVETYSKKDPAIAAFVAAADRLPSGA
ncbi:TRAP transporter substrate-binding protein [Roseomonas sp. E05]|uniref:TRAP transporter substrate-binding protein n=1 Tax=Roseomonas sp. E05 TaxID=3046310 RepID=UPI0024BBCA4E|nr:TRAP transporter substrate-binding protein [Roseomonas sp. E05]MDJ0389552.1 TRAP transporter substrate-binding protein [Roseomonas sp. E05]